MKNLALTALIMAVLTLISKCIGFVREMVMANYFGASYITDAYTMSFTILTVLFGGIIVAISTAYMPVYSKLNETSGKKAADAFTSSMINLLLIVSVIISIIGIIFSDQIIAVLASGFTGETAKLASFFIKVLFSYVVFSSTAGVMEAYLQYKGVFLPQIISGYFVSLCTIVAIVISAYTSHYYLAFGMLIGYALRWIVMSIILKRRNFVYTATLQIDTSVKDIVRMAFPTFVGSYAMLINQFIDKTLASRLVEGSISSLNYAGLLNTMIMGLTITILSTVLYPKLTQAVSLKQQDRFNDIFSTGLYIVIMVTLPFSLGAMLYSSQIVQIVYERGAFNSIATAMTSSAFLFYSVGLLFTSANELTTKAYYSMSDMKLPMIFSVISVIINIVLSLILVRYMAHGGLALATSIAALCNTALLLFGIKRKHDHIKLALSIKKLTKIISASVIAIGISYLIYQLIIQTIPHVIFMRTVQLAIPVILAMIVYLTLLKLFRIKEFDLITSILFRK